MHKSVPLAALALVTLMGCSSSPAGPASTSAPAPATSTSSSAPASSSSMPTTSVPKVKVAKKGVSSAECMAASTVLMNVTTIGLKASNGKVAQTDIDTAFSGADYAKIPADAKPYFDAIKAVSVKLIGLDAQGAAPLVGEFAAALGDVTDATQQICS